MENEEMKTVETKTETKSCGHAQNRIFVAMCYTAAVVRLIVR